MLVGTISNTITDTPIKSHLAIYAGSNGFEGKC